RTAHPLEETGDPRPLPTPVTRPTGHEDLPAIAPGPAGRMGIPAGAAVASAQTQRTPGGTRSRRRGDREQPQAPAPHHHPAGTLPGHRRATTARDRGGTPARARGGTPASARGGGRRVRTRTGHGPDPPAAGAHERTRAAHPRRSGVSGRSRPGPLRLQLTAATGGRGRRTRRSPDRTPAPIHDTAEPRRRLRTG